MTESSTAAKKTTTKAKTTPSRSSSASKENAKEELALATKEETKETKQPLELETQAPTGAIELSPKMTLVGNRPVEASHLELSDNFVAGGHMRPVVKSDLEIVATMSSSGIRPITASHLNISETYRVMGNRPVASNEIDDPTTLMGYLD
ncbi:MAG: hypothetical protein WA865_22930 [Spirulinaceae cyanobacterium]